MAAVHTVSRSADRIQTRHDLTCAHTLRVVGYVHGPPDPGLDCHKPLLMVCVDRCGYSLQIHCKNHRSSVCGPCAARYRRRVRAVAYSGMNRTSGHTYLLTLTAPGADAHCKKPGCRGGGDGLGCAHKRCSCTPVGGVDLAVWNATHSKRWNHFRTLLRRDEPEVQYMRGIEVQDGRSGGTSRGALHDHAMVWSPTPLSKRRLRELAMRAGFGHSVDLAECAPGSKRAAYYVSKYVTKATDSRSEVPWVDTTTGELVPGRYRTWSMSREWGVTMASVLADAAAYARTRNLPPLEGPLTADSGSEDSGTAPMGAPPTPRDP